MPEIWAGELGEIRALSTANGTALTTTAAFIAFPALAQAGDHKKGHLFITPRNFATAVVARVALNPWLVVLKTTDNMATLPTDYSIQAQDGSTSTEVDISSLDTIANGDWVLVGSHMPIRGVSLTMDGTNSTGSRTLSIDYWAGSWTSYSLSYSVAWTTAFDASTVVSWTPATNWITRKFTDLYPDLPQAYYSNLPLYWTRWSVNGALDSSTTIDHFYAANRSTVYSEWVLGQALEEKIQYGLGGLGNIEALTNAGTANLVVNLAIEKDGQI